MESSPLSSLLRGAGLPLALLALAACSSSSDGGSDSPAEDGLVDLLYYSGSLHFLEPGGSPVQVTSAEVMAGTLGFATVQSSTGHLRLDSGERALVLLDPATGTLQRMQGSVEPNTFPTTTNLAFGITDVTDFEVVPDFADPLDSRVVLERGNGETWIASAGTPGAPQLFPGRILATKNTRGTGAIYGWLAHSGGSLDFVFADLQAMFLAPANEVEVLCETIDYIWLLLDDNRLAVYSTLLGGLSLGDTLENHGLGESSLECVARGDRLYLLGLNSLGQITVLEQIAGNDIAFPSHSEPGLEARGIWTVGEQLAISFMSDQGASTLRVLGAGSQSVTISTSLRNDEFGSNGYHDSLLVFNVESGGTTYARVVSPTGIVLTNIPNARWIGVTPERTEDDLDELRASHFHLLFENTRELRVSGKDNPEAPTLSLGFLPSDVQDLFTTTIPSGTTHLAAGATIQGTDILEFDVETPSSLRRITSTPGISEFPTN